MSVTGERASSCINLYWIIASPVAPADEQFFTGSRNLQPRYPLRSDNNYCDSTNVRLNHFWQFKNRCCLNINRVSAGFTLCQIPGWTKVWMKRKMLKMLRSLSLNNCGKIVEIFGISVNDCVFFCPVKRHKRQQVEKESWRVHSFTGFLRSSFIRGVAALINLRKFHALLMTY